MSAQVVWDYRYLFSDGHFRWRRLSHKQARYSAHLRLCKDPPPPLLLDAIGSDLNEPWVHFRYIG